MGFGDLQYRCDTSRAALVIVDVQVDFCRPRDASAELLDTMVAMGVKLEGLIASARTASVPVVFVQTVHGVDSDSQAWRSRRGALAEYEREVCKPETEGVEFFRVAPEPGEAVIVKHRYDAFVGTELDAVLSSLGREAVILTGVMTDICVETTLRHAVCLDYLATMVSDCCAAATPERHELTLARVAQSFGSVASADEIASMWGAMTPSGRERVLLEHAPH